MKVQFFSAFFGCYCLLSFQVSLGDAKGSFNDIFPSKFGPTCMVTNFQAVLGREVQTLSGSCHSALSCKYEGGVPIGKCGTTNVCCIFPRTCNAVVNHNGTYFLNPNYPQPYNGSSQCTLTINKAPTKQPICQIRLDFVDFELSKPQNGECRQDLFIVSNQNSNNQIPVLCGFNTGQHVYVDVDSTKGPVTLQMITNGGGARRWNIQVSQIECLNAAKAPNNCLQYHLGPSGQFSSFNYELGPRVPGAVGTGKDNNNKDQRERFQEEGVGYLNRMDYDICFRKEAGFCSQTFYRVSENVENEVSKNKNSKNSEFSFDIVNKDERGGDTLGADKGGFDVKKCPQDFLLINGIRHCGRHLNVRFDPRDTGGMDDTSDFDVPVTDTGNGPIQVHFSSDRAFVGRGFKLRFQQNPCGSVPPASLNYGYRG